MARQRPTGVTIVAIIVLLNGLLTTIGAIVGLTGGEHVASSVVSLILGTLLLIAAFVNLVLWALAEFAYERMPKSLSSHSPPLWVRRLILTCALSFTAWAGCMAILRRQEDGSGVVWVAVILAAVGVYTTRRRADVFPLALISANVIAIVSSLIAQTNRYGDQGMLSIAFMLAVWLILSSTVSGRVLMHLLQKWRTAEATA